MQRTKPILLPLPPTTVALTHKPTEIITTANLEIQLMIQCKLVKAIYARSSSKIKINQITYEGDTVVVPVQAGKGESTKDIDMEDKQNCILLPPFRAAFESEEDQLSIKISKIIIDFKLYHVPKGRFVKNAQLDEIIEGRSEQWGPLSMDKSERMLLEPHNTTFPIIGLWISTHKSLSHPSNLLKLAAQVQQRTTRKCFFAIEGRRFFYLVRVGFQKRSPELLLVEWLSQGETQRMVPISRKQAFTQAEICVRSSEQASLEFTLRSDEKVPEPLLNITCSPIKFSSPGETTGNSLPDSPRFRLDHSGLLEQECASLRRLTREQQIQINDLRAEVLRLTGELRHCRRQKVNCDSQELSTSIASLHVDPRRRLTRSDLNYQQPSIANEEERKVDEGKMLQQWQKFEIVDPQGM